MTILILNLTLTGFFLGGGGVILYHMLHYSCVFVCRVSAPAHYAKLTSLWTCESSTCHVNISPLPHSELNEDPERRKRNPIPGCVDDDRDYQIFLLHIQPAQPPAVLHQMGQVEMPLAAAGDELDLSLQCQDIVSEHVGLIWRFHLWHASLPPGLDRLYIRK